MRDKSDYPNFPRSGRFRFHGAGKVYYRVWEDFLSEVTDEEPPPFPEFVKEWRRREFGFGHRTRAFARRLRGK
jgi:hypothetical protein